MTDKFSDTIVAIATPQGSGAIAIIRMSGKDTFKIIDKIFFSPKGKKISQQKPYTITYGYIKEKDKIIDEVLISKFKAPHSYTGEDSVEISCHGSIYIQRKIVEILINAGARTAQPGEFTLRAFLNGKIDLSQAEAVADMIAARSEAARKVAFSQLRGDFSKDLKKLRDELTHFTALLELELDFAEEDVEFANRRELLKLLIKIENHINDLKKSFSFGNAIKSGIPIAITGEPNVGKSTLLNVLLKEDKALVSDIPGTTRDAIEDVISINGILFRFIDTAGIRQTDNVVENLGIERTKQKILAAQIVIFIVDAQKSFPKDTFEEIRKLTGEKKLIIVLNKIDKTDKLSHIDVNVPVIPLSAKYKRNIERLEKALLEAIDYSVFTQNDIIITNERHYEALLRSGEALLRAREGIEAELSQEFVAQDIREALLYLGEITGEITTDDILGNIFKNFCIGK